MTEQPQVEPPSVEKEPQIDATAGCYRCGAEDGSMVSLCSGCRTRPFNLEDEHARMSAMMDDVSTAGQRGILWKLNSLLMNPVIKVATMVGLIAFVVVWVLYIVPTLSGGAKKKAGLPLEIHSV